MIIGKFEQTEARAGKHFYADGTSETIGGFVAANYETLHLPTLVDLKTFIETGTTANTFLTSGVSVHPQAVAVGRETKPGETTSEGFPLISRNNKNLTHRPQAGLLVIDIDGALGDTLADTVARLRAALPVLAHYTCLAVSSTSSNVYGPDGAQRKGLGGTHVYFHVSDATDIPRTLDVLHKRALVAGLDMSRVSAKGQCLVRSAVDMKLETPSQPIYMRAVLAPGMTQHKMVELIPGLTEVIDTRTILPALTRDEEVAFDAATRAIAQRLKPECDRVVKEYRAARVAELVDNGMTEDAALRAVEVMMTGNTLPEGLTIYPHRKDPVTVAQINANPTAWHGVACRDPMEPDYGSSTTAKIYADSPEPYIASFAHTSGDKPMRYSLGVDTFAREAAKMPPGVMMPQDAWADAPDMHAVVTVPETEPVDVMQPLVGTKLPEHCVLPVLRPLLAHEAPAMGVPREIMFGACVAGAAAALDHRIVIKPYVHRGWEEHPRLWMALIGDPSIKKTPAINMALKPARRINSDNTRTDSARIAQYETDLKRWNTAVKKYTDGKSDAMPEGLPPTHPETHTLFVSDVTVAKLSDILQWNPRGVTVVRDELSGWMASVEGRGEGAMNRAAYLQLYNGGEYPVHRVGRGDVIVDNWSASIIGGIQPAALKEAMKNLPHDGLLQRFYPIIANRAAKATNAATDPTVMRGYQDIVARLSGQRRGRDVQLSDEATAILEKCWGEVFTLTSSGNLSETVTAHLNKWEGGLYRWALVLHAIHCACHGLQAVDYLVGAETAQIVADLHMDFFLPNVFALYDDILGDGGDGEHVRWIAGYILAHPEQTVIGPRVIHQHYRAFRKLDDAGKRRVFRFLEDAGWVTPNDESFLPRHWTVNPRVHTKFTEQAVAERERRNAVIAKIKGVDI
ncbi:DUF3987 domain-containing protein [Shimia aestuarii]|uniref:DUF3987 domain-containing protein n=1 Tax=Shimia aestuarii TaxID=254406 RepID=A0A1I4N6R5_9RHOB|nr:DUF3987 domain-containing protein [Shimia aestuarii]SFM11189.1 Protein of unknown function [Shimia aestuarii]